jgi:hypothetical protein
MMSRYRIPPNDPRYEVIIGWDDPLETYFATVFDTTVDEDDDTACVLWEGAALRAMPTVDVLQACLQAYTTIPSEIRTQLHHDRTNSRPRSPLQERLLQLMTPCVEKEPL